MAIIQCINGHYYDDAKYAGCPHCEGSSDSSAPCADADNVTQSFVTDESLVHSELAAMVYGSDEKTVGFFQSKMHADPVVAWLVCVDGPEKGRDYRLHTGRNFVGRAYAMDVSIPEDAGISRDNHCSVVFDPMHGEFLLVPGEGTVTYLNETACTEAAAIQDDDRIKIGESEFVFIAFCKEERSWL